ncbi:putative ribonuclease H-like domain-containing protein [Tanacetum coccineum]|uniref:Ribonuclease H-like domain-containing protein n=1 Tax=Tanacetum coccineum TaxID=301880 RepID=A0ABQ4WKW7_9ASTR
MESHTLQQLRGYSFDEIKVLFKATAKRVNTFTPMKSDDTIPKVVTGSSKRSVEEELVLEEGMNVKALQTKYPIIDWEVYTEDSRIYWKIIRVERGHDIFMLVEKDYPLTRGLMTLMLCNKLQVDQHSEMKLDDLKGAYDMWKLRIEQYFQVQDDALWDIIENGNSFKLAAQTTTNVDGSSTTLIPGLVTADEKTQTKNDVKARKDLNLKFLRSLPSEWNTHVVVWRNKPDLDTMSFDDLYNNFKIVEQEVKGTASLSSSSSSQNLAFMSSTSSTNEVNTAYGVSTANTQASTASTQVSTANLSDDTVYAFLASQPNGSQLVHEDLEQIHEDDLEEMDLKWQLALLSMRTRKFFQKTGRKITINGSDTAGYDKSKVECFNCHKLGHFARECRGPRNQDNRSRNQDSSRRTINVEEISSKAMLAIDGAGFDWSFMADEEVPSDMALMAFSDSEVHNDKTCSKTCLKSFETLKTQLDDLRIEFNKSEFNLATYKRGLASVEEQLVFYKKNEVLFCEQLAVLKRDISYKDSEISVLKSELEKLKQDKESNQLKIEKFDNASKSLDKLIGSQIPDKSRKGLGFAKFEGYGPKISKSVSEDISNEVMKSPDTPLVEELANCNYHQRERMVSGNNYRMVNYNYSAQKAHPSTQRNMAPRAVLMKTGLRPLNIARPVNTAHPKTIVYSARLMPKAVNTARPNTAVVNAVKANQVNAVKASACWVHPQIENQGYVDSGCSRHITGKMSYLLDFKEFDGGYVTFGGGAKGGRITSKGTLKIGKLDFGGVYFVKELQFNLFSISQMCDKKNNVLFTDTGCFVLCPDFKLADESQVLLKVPRKNNMYSVDMKNIVPKECLTCLVAKATLDESMLLHRRLETQSLFLMNKKHYLVVTDDYSRFTWVFFLATKDEPSGILKSFITEIENLVDKNVKVIRCDNGTKRNRTLLTAARTMLADSKLPTTFRAESVNTTCYVQNRVLVVKPHNKTPYELFRCRTPALSFIGPFGCHVTILNTLDYSGKFDGKSDDGFFVGYSLNSKAFRVYKIRTRKVEESLHIKFLKDKPIITGDGPKWLFDIDVLTQSINYVPVVAGTNSNDFTGTEESFGAGNSNKETGSSQDYIVIPLWKDGSLFDSSLKNASDAEPQPFSDIETKDDGVSKDSGLDDQERPANNTQDVKIARPNVNTASTNVNIGSPNINTVNPKVTTAPIEATYDDLSGIHKDHSLAQVIGDIQSGVLTRRMIKTTNDQGFISAVYEGKTHEDLHTCLFACFLSQEEPKRIAKALSDSAWVKVMQEELLQNKKDERGIVIRIKARLVAQEYTQEEGIYYDEFFALVARIMAIRLFLAYASFMGFMVYQMDVKSAFLYGKIEEEVYVCQPPRFEDPDNPDKVYKVVTDIH